MMKSVKQKSSIKSLFVVAVLIVLVVIGGFTVKLLLQAKPETMQVAAGISPILTPQIHVIHISPFATLSSDWKTYSDPLHCYSFSVPTDWKVSFEKLSPKPKDCSSEGVTSAAFEDSGHAYHLTLSIGAQAGSDLLPGERLVKKKITIEHISYDIQERIQSTETQPYIVIVSPADIKQQFSKVPIIYFDGIDGYEEHHVIISEHQMNLFNKVLLTLRFKQ